MHDIIKLLPDSVANQIAAGEVIQRPASAVKELLENAVDAGAEKIQLIISDAGKTLIQVVDNGSGMSEKDAELCYERHATSKIGQAEDLFSIQTMGFRGEALASMAAISRLEIKTRKADSDIGTEVIIEASKPQSKNACNCPAGTSIAVKNLFFNTPARRAFLKSDNIEKRHILQEFQRIAIARPDIEFKFYQNGQLTHHLYKSNLKQRVVNLFGNNYNQRLVPLEESTQIVNISGFIGKPEYAKKTRGEQFIFINKRFIRSPYLSHAVENAFEGLLPEDSHPSYFIFLETDPDQIDVNVHPAKTEVKFRDEKYIYQIIKTAARHSLGSHNISPSLDFERETAFDDIPPTTGDQPVKPPVIRINPDYNPFEKEKSASLSSRVNPKQWEQIYPQEKDIPSVKSDLPGNQYTISPDWDNSRSEPSGGSLLQLHLRYIISPVKSGLMIIDQQRAHERILYERFSASSGKKESGSQQLLFPENIRLNETDAAILREIKETVKSMGFGLNELGRDTFVIDSVPCGMPEDHDLGEVLEGILENYQKNKLELRNNKKENVIRSLSRRLAVNHGKLLTEQQMSALVNDLFSCEIPQYTPSGKPVLQIITSSELSERFK